MTAQSFIRLTAFLLMLTQGAAFSSADPLPMGSIPGGLGVNIHFVKARPGELDQMKTAGIRWIRTDFAWAGIEKAKGVYSFGPYDALLDDLQKHQIRAWLILDYANPIYEPVAPHDDAGRAAFARFAAAAVKHFAGRGVVWEMWNEPNIGFWKPKPNVDDYIKLSRAAGHAVHQADANAIFIGPGTSLIDFKFIEPCFKAGCLDDWAAVSVHPYRQGGPESVVAEYDSLRKIISKYAPGKNIPVLSGEWGYSVAWKNFDEQKQADFLAREWLINQWQQIPISIWYDWRNDGTNPKDAEHHFGLVQHDPSAVSGSAYPEKPAYRAARTLAATLDGYHCLGRCDLGRNGDFLLLFAKGDERVLAAWTIEKTPHEMEIHLPGGTFSVTSISGAMLYKDVIKDGTLHVQAGSSPVYLALQGDPAVLDALSPVHP